MKVLMTAIITMIAVMSSPVFAKSSQHILIEAQTYYTPVWGLRKAVFKTQEKNQLSIVCRWDFPFSDTVKISVFKNKKKLKDLTTETKIENADNCDNDLKEMINSLEDGKQVEVKIGLAGFRFTEL